jgi:hypothetical protein
MKIPPEVNDGLTTFGIGGADSERSFYLTREAADITIRRSPNDKGVVRVPPQMLGLEMNFIDVTIHQDWRN